MKDRIRKGGFLALDWGAKKIGLATGDPSGSVVTAYKILKRDPAAQRWIANAKDLEALGKICKELEIGNLVLGLPLLKGAEETEASQQSRKLADYLEKKLHRPVFLVDEHLSSWEAKKSVRGDDDAEAAALFLRDLFETLKLS